MAQKVAFAAKHRTIDDELAAHLEKAEEHLIAAVKLFARKAPPQRHKDFLDKLTRHQEGVTGLFREELVRMRGPMSVKFKVKVKK